MALAHGKEFKVSEEDLTNTPPAVLAVMSGMGKEILQLRKRVEELEAKLARNSSNSNNLPSQDSPYKENVRLVAR